MNEAEIRKSSNSRAIAANSRDKIRLWINKPYSDYGDNFVAGIAISAPAAVVGSPLPRPETRSDIQVSDMETNGPKSSTISEQTCQEDQEGIVNIEVQMDSTA